MFFPPNTYICVSHMDKEKWCTVAYIRHKVTLQRKQACVIVSALLCRVFVLLLKAHIR